MFTRVALIFPPSFESHWGAIRPPIGLGYLSEMLMNHQIEHQVIDMSLGYSAKQVQQKIAAFQTDLIGVSMTSLFYRSVYALLHTLKAAFPTTPIVVGGPHISTLRERVLHDCSAIDYAIALEGEDALIELCQGKLLDQIKGLFYRTGSASVPLVSSAGRMPALPNHANIHYTGDRKFILDLDRLPFPTYRQFELKNYVAREIGVITSRGCPYGCTFCPVKTTIGRTTRLRSVGPLADELEYWHQRDYRDILILDDNFAMKPERVYALCDELERRGLTDFRFRCGNGIRADHVDAALLQRMFEVGFRFLSFGVESANDHILQTIKKGERLARIEQAVKAACEIGYDVTLFFIIGLPGETVAEAEASLQFARKYPIFDAKFYNLIPFPNTEIYDWIETHRYFLAAPEEYLNTASHWDAAPLFETPEFSRAERVRMLRKAHRVRQQIRKAAMQRKLKKFGWLSSLASEVFVSDRVQDLLLHNKLVRRCLEGTFRRISP